MTPLSLHPKSPLTDLTTYKELLKFAKNKPERTQAALGVYCLRQRQNNQRCNSASAAWDQRQCYTARGRQQTVRLKQSLRSCTLASEKFQGRSVLQGKQGREGIPKSQSLDKVTLKAQWQEIMLRLCGRELEAFSDSARVSKSGA